jgi:nitrogen fixation/metabolism regulation signal transduction histidine kinase
MKLGFELRVLLLALAVGLPGTAAALLFFWGPPAWLSGSPLVVSAVLVGLWVYLALALRRRIVFPLQTISNLIAALREGDFSVRGRQSDYKRNDTLAELVREVNDLAQTLHTQRLGAVEAAALLGKVMEEIGVAVFAFDAGGHLKLLNRSGERLINRTAEAAIGKTAVVLGLESYLKEEGRRLVDASFAGGSGRWEIRRSSFRQEGLPHQLLVISDLTRTLREEELQAWQRIVRVIGHEINNSLTPIKSISETLQSQLSAAGRPADWEEDLEKGLAIIAARSASLGRFITAYTKLARLPQPKFQPMEISALVHRVAALETRVPVKVLPGQPTRLSGDADQLEQVLINLVRNAADASLETGGGVEISWTHQNGQITVDIADEGHGLANTSNLFVPFFTTKPGGSGIGLVLSRQIVEAHGGSLQLENRSPKAGCLARLRLSSNGNG